MTNLIKESTTNIINELLDDIKENIIQINDNSEQIQLNTVKPTNITNLLEKKIIKSW